MAETVQQYVRRIRGYVAGKDPLRVQQATPGRIRKLVRRLPDRKSTRLNSSHIQKSRMPSSA